MDGTFDNGGYEFQVLFAQTGQANWQRCWGIADKEWSYPIVFTVRKETAWFDLIWLSPYRCENATRTSIYSLPFVGMTMLDTSIRDSLSCCSLCGRSLTRKQSRENFGAVPSTRRWPLCLFVIIQQLVAEGLFVYLLKCFHGWGDDGDGMRWWDAMQWNSLCSGEYITFGSYFVLFCFVLFRSVQLLFYYSFGFVS